MYWAVAQVEANRAHVATHFLNLAGYTVYVPRIATARREPPALLFPGYVFVQIVSGWWNARWSVGVVRLISTVPSQHGYRIAWSQSYGLGKGVMA